MSTAKTESWIAFIVGLVQGRMSTAKTVPGEGKDSPSDDERLKGNMLKELRKSHGNFLALIAFLALLTQVMPGLPLEAKVGFYIIAAFCAVCVGIRWAIIAFRIAVPRGGASQS